MDKFNYYLDVVKNYTKFDGRARRSEYWYFVSFNMIISIVLGSVGGAIDFPLISTIYSLGVLLPSIAVAIRRMHDVGKSGWFMLIPFYNLYLAVQDSVEGDNEYGANPKGDSDELNEFLEE